jgi:hypothetical protein
LTSTSQILQIREKSWLVDGQNAVLCISSGARGQLAGKTSTLAKGYLGQG